MKYYVNNNVLFSSLTPINSPLFSEITRDEYYERIKDAKENRNPGIPCESVVEGEVETW